MLARSSQGARSKFSPPEHSFRRTPREQRTIRPACCCWRACYRHCRYSTSAAATASAFSFSLLVLLASLSNPATGTPILVGGLSDRSYVSASPLAEGVQDVADTAAASASTSTTIDSLLSVLSYYGNHDDYAGENSDRGTLAKLGSPSSRLHRSTTKAPLVINDQFDTKLATIIRTRESLSSGATFLNYTLVTSLNACLVECWITDSCDTVIYQESPVDFNNHLPSVKAHPQSNPTTPLTPHQFTHHYKHHRFMDGIRKGEPEVQGASNFVPERQPHLQDSHYSYDTRHYRQQHIRQQHHTSSPNFYDFSEQQPPETEKHFPVEGSNKRKQRGISPSSSSSSSSSSSGSSSGSSSIRSSSGGSESDSTHSIGSSGGDGSNSSSSSMNGSKSKRGSNSSGSTNSNSYIRDSNELLELPQGPTDGGSGFFLCYLFQCAKTDGFKCQFSPHNYYISSTVLNPQSHNHLSSSEDNYHVIGSRDKYYVGNDDEEQATIQKNSDTFLTLNHKQQQQSVRYSSIVERSNHPHWFTRHDSHVASIHIGGHEELAHLGGFTSAIIAILMGIGATGVLMIIVGHKMKSIRKRIAHKRRRALPADHACAPVDLLTNSSLSALLMPI